MTRQSVIVFALLLWVVGCIAPASESHAGPNWNIEHRVAEVAITRTGQLLSFRFDGEDEFTPVEQGVVPSLVEDLAFYARDLPLAAYLGEIDDVEYLGLWSPPWCRKIFAEIASIVGPIFIELPFDLDDPMVIKYPEQTVTISKRGETVDFGGGPELPTFWARVEPVTGVDFRGYRRFTLFEFFEPDTSRVISRNIVSEEPFH